MSKKAFVYFLAVVSVVWIILLQLNGLNEEGKNIEDKGDKASSVIVENEEKPKPDAPAFLYIPKLQVQAPVESIGLDGNGRMDIPKNANDVAWYNLGFKPGEKGSAVIAGHLDTVTGAPAVFYYLYLLEVGDEIIVVDKKNNEYKFLVTDKKNYNFDSFPLPEVFADTKQAGLNLITCNGSWNYQTRNYSHRTVVFSKLSK